MLVVDEDVTICRQFRLSNYLIHCMMYMHDALFIPSIHLVAIFLNVSSVLDALCVVVSQTDYTITQYNIQHTRPNQFVTEQQLWREGSTHTTLGTHSAWTDTMACVTNRTKGWSWREGRKRRKRNGEKKNEGLEIEGEGDVWNRGRVWTVGEL